MKGKRLSLWKEGRRGEEGGEKRIFAIERGKGKGVSLEGEEEES